MKTKHIRLTCHSPALHFVTKFDGTGKAYLAILQALQFAIEHKTLFEKEGTECPDCFRVIEQLQEEISQLMHDQVEHYHAEHAN